MYPTKEMAEPVLLWLTIVLWNGIEKGDKEELQGVCDKNLLGILEDKCVIWNSPARRVVFHGLQMVSLAASNVELGTSYSIQK